MLRLLSLGLLLALSAVSVPAASAERPNIMLIMVDDMGFSDIGCYGGEIKTPNLDRLAANGLRFTQFYNCAKCETTRATLLSGRYYQEVAVQQMTHCMTIAEVMRMAGYTTLMAGKWHLKSTPIDRGFDRYFGHLSGATNFFKGDKTFRLDNQPWEVPDHGFYTTDADTDYAIQFLNERDRSKPFFLYVAYNAPHYPLQAPRKEVDKYHGKYRIGWDALRKQRFAKIKELGILPADLQLAPRPADVPAWSSLSTDEQDEQDLMMATYAGMIDRVDQNIGRLVETLQEKGDFENTLVLFLSDNGACPFQRTSKQTREKHLMPWNPASYWTYDKRWAHACNTPFREYKRNQHEGGISTPLIAHWPQGIRNPGRITRQTGHLVDIMATCVQLSGAKYPNSLNGKPVGPLRGSPLTPIFLGKQRAPHEYLFFSFYGIHNALRIGDWKLVNIDRGPWELYDIKTDRTELHDLAKEQPEQLQRMKKAWDAAIKTLGDPSHRGRGKRNKKKRS